MADVLARLWQGCWQQVSRQGFLIQRKAELTLVLPQKQLELVQCLVVSCLLQCHVQAGFDSCLFQCHKQAMFVFVVSALSKVMACEGDFSNISTELHALITADKLGALLFEPAFQQVATRPPACCTIWWLRK